MISKFVNLRDILYSVLNEPLIKRVLGVRTGAHLTIPGLRDVGRAAAIAHKF